MGCQPEVDSIWNITWPPTEVGEVATRKCPGGGEVTGMHMYVELIYHFHITKLHVFNVQQCVYRCVLCAN